MKYSKEEKAAYFKSLREKWQAAKELSETDEYKAVYLNTHSGVSSFSFAFVYMQMQALKLDGIPYIDMKTYDRWRGNGFQVIKGEKSQISGITWINTGENEDENGELLGEDGFIFPKEYHLFHRSQVSEIGG